MAQHGEKFTQIVDQARKNIKECSVQDIKRRLDSGDQFYLVDCREDHEWSKSHLPKAIHIGKGIIERDIEGKIPDTDADIVVYCGGGYRSALAADALKRMGYTRVVSMDGGFRGWQEAGFPLANS